MASPIYFSYGIYFRNTTYFRNSVMPYVSHTNAATLRLQSFIYLYGGDDLSRQESLVRLNLAVNRPAGLTHVATRINHLVSDFRRSEIRSRRHRDNKTRRRHGNQTFIHSSRSIGLWTGCCVACRCRLRFMTHAGNVCASNTWCGLPGGCRVNWNETSVWRGGDHGTETE